MKILVATTPELRYVWEVNVFLENMRKWGLSKDVHILVYTSPKLKTASKEWNIVQALYPETRFFFYPADEKIVKIQPVYNPIYRPWILTLHFEALPELTSEPIFYLDSDIIFIKEPKIEHLIDSGATLLSSTVVPSDYMSHSYLDSKEKDVIPEKLTEFKSRDIVDELGGFFGLSRKQIEEHKHQTGGAQYILRNITPEFWGRVFIGCLNIKIHLSDLNQAYFPGATYLEKENNGYQAFCADMWSILYTLWQDGIETLTPPEMDFAWATDPISRLEQNPEIFILHNAGITSDGFIRSSLRDENNKPIIIDAPAFYKGRYSSSEFTPFNDIKYLESIVYNEESQKWATSIYARAVLETQKTHNLNY